MVDARAQGCCCSVDNSDAILEQGGLKPLTPEPFFSSSIPCFECPCGRLYHRRLQGRSHFWR